MFCHITVETESGSTDSALPNVEKVMAVVSTHIKLKFLPSEERNRKRDGEICLVGQAMQCLTEMIKL